MAKRVVVAGLFHETHTFLEGCTGLGDFETRHGQELFDCSGDASPLAGALQAASDCGWDVLPALHMHAMPGPVVDDAVIEYWWRHLLAVLQREMAAGVDGVFLVLHGAMVSTLHLDVEGELLERLRGVVGPDTPVGGVTDLHANFSSRMARYSNALLTYRENPHTDGHETAHRAALLLDGLLLSRSRAKTLWRQPPLLLLPPTGTATASDPMRALLALARRSESPDSGILAVNVHAGYAYADTPDTGVSFTSIATGDTAAADALLRQMSDLARRLGEAGCPSHPPLDEVLPEVKLLAQQGRGPVLLVEPADNIGGGAPGDDTAVLRALVTYGFEKAGVIINDPEAVAALAELHPGESRRLDIGGKGSALGSGPLPLDVQLISTSDGKFQLEDAQSHLASMTGLHVDMGPCAVVSHHGVTILLTSRKTPPFDLSQWRSQGIDPASLSVIGVKAAVAHRRAYDRIAFASFTVSTPGPCPSDLKLLPYRHIRRPVFPLDAAAG